MSTRLWRQRASRPAQSTCSPLGCAVAGRQTPQRSFEPLRVVRVPPCHPDLPRRFLYALWIRLIRREVPVWKVCKQALSATPAVLALCLSAGVTMAQQPTDAQKNAIRNSCRSDFMTNCSGVTPSGAEALQCLQHNSAKLSSACQSAVAAISPPAAPAAAPPAPSSASTADAAAPAARTAAPPRKPTSAQRVAIRKACQANFLSRCPGVQPGGVQALQCLQGHAPELSAGCRHALAAIGGAAVATAAIAPVPAPPPVVAEPPIGPIPPLPVRFRLEILNICRAEQMQFCSEVPPGGGRLIDCLVANQASISPGCRRALLWASH
jgi:hypothetical protein